MIPSTGWLPAGSNSNGLPLEGVLPVPMTGTYSEGGTFFGGTTEVDFLQIAALITLSSVAGRFGYTVGQLGVPPARMFQATLTQPKVFGVAILDSFTPPEISQEFFEFNAYTQLACLVDPLVGVGVEFSGCFTSADQPYSEDSQATPVYGDA